MKARVAVLSMLVLALFGFGAWFLTRNTDAPATTLTMRLSVEPSNQVAFVVREAGAARLKYLAGKQSSVKPVFAQRLSVEPAPEPGQIVAKVAVENREEARRYAEVFLRLLRAQLGNQVRVTLVEQTVR